jgi:hypothetical protein
MSRRKSFDCWWRRPYAIQSAPSLMCLILLRVCCFIATRKLMPVISCAAWEIHCMRLPRKSSAFSIGLVAPSQYVYSNLIQVHGCSRLNMHTKYHRKIYTCTWKIRSKRWDAWMVSANKLNIWVNNNERKFWKANSSVRAYGCSSAQARQPARVCGSYGHIVHESRQSNTHPLYAYQLLIPLLLELVPWLIGLILVRVFSWSSRVTCLAE